MDKTTKVVKEVKQAQKVVEQWWSDPLTVKILLGVAGFIIIRLVVAILNHYLWRFVKDQQTRYRAKKITAFVGYLVILLYLAIVFKDRLGGLTIALGVAGAGVAFALQEVIASVAGWAAINFAGFYSIGHRIQLGGIKGDVIDIGVLRTTLMELGEWVSSDLYTGRIVRIANSFVFKEPVFNYSGDFPFLWDEVTVPIKFGSDFRLARKLMEDVIQEIIGEYSNYAQQAWKDIVKKYYVEKAMIDPMVTMVFNDNWIEFTIRYIVDFKLRRVTKNRVFWQILEEIDKTGGKVKIASATIQLVDPQPFKVQLEGKT